MAAAWRGQPAHDPLAAFMRQYCRTQSNLVKVNAVDATNRAAIVKRCSWMDGRPLHSTLLRRDRCVVADAQPLFRATLPARRGAEIIESLVLDALAIGDA